MQQECSSTLVGRAVAYNVTGLKIKYHQRQFSEIKHTNTKFLFIVRHKHKLLIKHTQLLITTVVNYFEYLGFPTCHCHYYCRYISY